MQRARPSAYSAGAMLVVSLAVAAGVALFVAMILYAPELREPGDDGR